jgi:hypothetical protein
MYVSNLSSSFCQGSLPPPPPKKKNTFELLPQCQELLTTDKPNNSLIQTRLCKQEQYTVKDHSCKNHSSAIKLGKESSNLSSVILHIIYPQKLALTLPTSGGRSRTKTTELLLLLLLVS